MPVYVGPTRVVQKWIGTARYASNEFWYGTQKFLIIDYPDAPQNLKVSATTSTSLTVAWDGQAGFDAAAVYRVRWRTSADGATPAGNWSTLRTTPLTSYTISSLNTGSSYDVDVYSVNVANDDGGSGSPERKSSLDGQLVEAELVPEVLLSGDTETPAGGTNRLAATPSGFDDMSTDVYTYSWRIVSGGGTLASQSGNGITYVSGTGGSREVQVSCTVTRDDRDGEEQSATGTYRFRVRQNLFQVSIQAPVQIDDDQVALLAVRVNSNIVGTGTTYAWSHDGEGDMTFNAAGDVATYDPDGDDDVVVISLTATRTLSDGTKLTATASHSLQVLADGGHVFAQIEGTSIVDQGSTHSYTVHPRGALASGTRTYEWTADNGEILSGQGTTTISYRAQALGTGESETSVIRCKVSRGGRSYTARYGIVVRGADALVVDVTVDKDVIAKNESALFTAVVVGEVPTLTVEITGAGAVDEGGVLDLGATVGGNAVGDIEYLWSCSDSAGTAVDGTFDDAASANPKWTAPQVGAAGATYSVACQVTRQGVVAEATAQIAVGNVATFRMSIPHNADLSAIDEGAAKRAIRVRLAGEAVGSLTDVSASATAGSAVVREGSTITTEELSFDDDGIGLLFHVDYTPPASVSEDTSVTITVTATRGGQEATATGILTVKNTSKPAGRITNRVTRLRPGTNYTFRSADTNGAVTWRVTGGGSITAAGVYTAPNTVAASVTVSLLVDGTVVDTDNFRVSFLSGSISNPLGSLREDSTWTFKATGVAAGSTVSWRIFSGGGTIDPSTGLYTPPDVMEDEDVIVVLVVDGEDTDSDHFIVVPVSDLPAANISSASLAISPRGILDHQTATVTATVAGTWDELTIAWSADKGGRITGSGTSVTFRPPTVSQETIFTITASITARGDGTNYDPFRDDTVERTVTIEVNP